VNILHVVPTYLPATRYGGPIVAVHGLARALVRRGHDVSVLTTNVDGSLTSDVPVGRVVDLDGVKVRYFASPLRRLYWSPALGAALREHVPHADVVHTHSVFLWPTYAAARAASATNVPYVISPRGMLVPELIAAKSRWMKRGWIRMFERRSFREASAIHFTSDLELRDAERTGLPIPRAFIAPNGIDIPELADTPRVPDRILFLGRISWKKRIDRLIEALPMLPNAQLVIAGNDEEGLLPELQRIAARLGVASQITWRGPIHGDEKQLLLASASVFALTSDSENFGNAVLEALAQQTPVVLTRGVGVGPEIANAGAGVIAGDSPREIANTLDALLADTARLRQMGKAGRELVIERFDWDRVAATMESLYASIANPEARARAPVAHSGAEVTSPAGGSR
jgi:glycosyltransferase involved in cell wall biosynthesis